MKTQKPVIAITVSREEERLVLHTDCAQAITRAGGLPVLLPVDIDAADAAALLQRCDGVLFSGGPDMDPIYYGEEVLAACGAIDARRDAAEAACFAAARALGLPVLGICRGHQLINVLCGGDLYQDIDSQLPRTTPLQHTSRSGIGALLHSVQVKPGSLLAQLTQGAPLRVTSTHHQAVRRVGAGLTVSAAAPDGVIEALEAAQGPFLLCVQWHPERMFTTDTAALALFEGLVKAAADYRKKQQEPAAVCGKEQEDAACRLATSEGTVCPEEHKETAAAIDRNMQRTAAATSLNGQAEDSAPAVSRNAQQQAAAASNQEGQGEDSAVCQQAQQNNAACPQEPANPAARTPDSACGAAAPQREAQP